MMHSMLPYALQKIAYCSHPAIRTFPAITCRFSTLCQSPTVSGIFCARFEFEQTQHSFPSIGESSTQLLEARATVTHTVRSEEHTSELQSLMRISYAVFCLKK